MQSLVLPLLLLPTSASASDGVSVDALLEAESLEVGGSYEITVAALLDEGVSVSDAGQKKILLQLDVPPSVRLAGRHLTEYRDLARNEFLEAPYERLLEGELTTIGFELATAPAEGETIGLVFTAYVTATGPDGGRREGFFRRRLELPLEPGAKAREGDASDSSWGTDEALLKIGDRAADFELPRLGSDGSIRLGELVGGKNVLVTTYRAHW